MIIKSPADQHDEINLLFGPPERATATRIVRERGAPAWWHGDDEASQTSMIARTQAPRR